MPSVKRRYTFKLYPSRLQREAMERECELHRELYNAALQQRIEAWRRRETTLSYADQCRELTQLRREDERFGGLNCHALQETLKRLDRAFASFFRRAKTGRAPGFPRFKARDRWPGWSYKLQGDGMKFMPNEDWQHGKLRLQGIGVIRTRGRVRTPGRIVCGEILQCTEGWYLSVVVECAPERVGGSREAAGLDWGVESFASLVTSGCESRRIANPTRLRKAQRRLARLQRICARRRRRGRPQSARYMRARAAVSRLHGKLARQRAEFLHQATKKLVAEFALIATEDLSIRNMTTSAKGSVEEPGRNVRQKAGLNREILDTAPAMFLQMLAYKAEEAGIELVLLDPRKTRASQTCPACGTVEKKPLGQREHECSSCGHAESRDHAAARTLLRLAMEGNASGWEPARREGQASLEAGPRNHAQSRPEAA